jgi:hypothetical protein
MIHGLPPGHRQRPQGGNPDWGLGPNPQFINKIKGDPRAEVAGFVQIAEAHRMTQEWRPKVE